MQEHIADVVLTARAGGVDVGRRVGAGIKVETICGKVGGVSGPIASVAGLEKGEGIKDKWRTDC